MFNRALALLRALFGAQADFRRDQWEAIEALVVQRRRLLVIERSGWGKSVVCLIATRLLRELGLGPTLLVTPARAFGHNRLAMARKLGIRTATASNSSRQEWDAAETVLAQDSCDLLLISPERLGSAQLLSQILELIHGRIGMLVVDEAQCISDWGHDFRPEYRHIDRVIKSLPPIVPVLATVAAANGRIIKDIRQQLGDDTHVIRGPLARGTLRLQNLRIPGAASRLAWLSENLPKFGGRGVIYCLTVAAAELVATWLNAQGIDASVYHASIDRRERERLEHHLFKDERKVVVGTAALGIGFELPDLAFVVHYQRPASVVAYYQQANRAGRGSEKTYGILLAGEDDERIHRFFIDRARPRSQDIRRVLDQLAEKDGQTFEELLDSVNLRHDVIERALKTLETDGAIEINTSTGKPRFVRTLHGWQPDIERLEELTRSRQVELAQMHSYIRERGCLMEFLTRAMDDPEARPCGICSNCQGRGLLPAAATALVAHAVEFLQEQETTVRPHAKARP